MSITNLYNIVLIEQRYDIICRQLPMSINNALKEKAVNLRKQGLTLSEVLKEIPVAKSTLSLWFKDVGLSKAQKQRITDKRIAASRRGALAKKDKRIALSNKIFSKSEKEIGLISKRELWLIGTALYWAEGAKEKSYRPGSGVKFSNSDPAMIRLFILWLRKCHKIPDEDFIFQIYVHDGDLPRIGEIINYWSKQTGFSLDCFKYVYYKRNKINTKRKNVGNLYFGLLRVNIRRSSGLLRRIKGWVNGININCGIV